MDTIVGLCSTQCWIAQLVIAQEFTASVDAALLLSGTQGFLVLIAGLLLAFAFGLLLTNFFIALGISDSTPEHELDTNGQASMDDKINQVGTIVGLRTLGTVSITLFFACFLAVKLCPLHDPLLAAIIGLVIWAAYFFLLVWVSVTTVGSVLGSVLDQATSGLQGIIGTATIGFGAKTISDRVVSTADAAAAAVRNELGSATDRTSIHKAIDNYLNQLQLSEEARLQIEDEFEKLVAQPEMQSLTKENYLRNIGRKTFVDIVDSRTDLSKQDINWFVDSFEGFWQQIWGNQPQKVQTNGLPIALKSAEPKELKPNRLSPKVEQFINQICQQQARQQAEASQKVAETAAWWLFGTAFFSAAAAASAAAISVGV
ncbi:MAG: hypothetical protein KME46_16140 [Brasilonema angustatum HA4187-MV1]|jgi:hypothetical protein|nr:hypothetical protein [Brasilonema angustatum HA4187-MV1]